MLTFIVCVIAGLGAGIGTGLAGLSAAAVISPMLITFLNMNAFDAVGIALSSDVLASAISAYNYHKNKNVDLKNGIYILLSVMIFTIIGSYIASLLPNSTMGGFSVGITVLLGIKFIVKPVMKETDHNVTDVVDFDEMSDEEKEIYEKEQLQKRKDNIIKSLICGAPIGLICGFIGAGGGMMMLMILTSVLAYELKVAVGTSVFVMAFTALTGAVSHFSISGHIPDVTILTLCIIFTLLGAQIASKFANKAPVATLNKVTGYVLLGLGIIMVVANLL